MGRERASVICEAARATRGARLVRSPLAGHARSHTCLIYFLCVLSHGFPSKRETARSLLRTLRSAMFSCSRGVQEPLKESISSMGSARTADLVFSLTLPLLFGFTSRFRLRGHKFSSTSTMSPVSK